MPESTEWVSNIGNDTEGAPASLNECDDIEIKRRNGMVSFCKAGDWSLFWKETSNHPLDIVAYRKGYYPKSTNYDYLSYKPHCHNMEEKQP